MPKERLPVFLSSPLSMLPLQSLPSLVVLACSSKSQESVLQCQEVSANLSSTLYMKITPKSGAGLHKILLRSVMRAPQSFFDETDSGITLNRFSQDMTLIDGNLPAASVMASSCEQWVPILCRYANSIQRCFPDPSPVRPCCGWIILHGRNMSHINSGCVRPPESLPSYIQADEILGPGMQKPLIYSFCRDS
jgi:hypothetical protein